MITLFNKQPETRRIMIMSAIVLGGFALFASSLLSITEKLTRQAIIESEQQTLLKNLNGILPAKSYDNELLKDQIQISDPLLGTTTPLPAYRARLKGKFTAIFISGEATNGYNGRIKLLVGIKADDTLAGVRVIAHKETPGLGDDIDLNKSKWILGFDQKSLTNPPAQQWKVIKDGGVFDQFTGATITPRAVVQAVHKILRYYAKNKIDLISSIQTE